MHPNETTATKIAGHLLDIGAVSLSPDQPFTWASGIRSPIYCDNRMTLGYPEIRSLIADAFVAQIRAGKEMPEVIVGTATAGIPHAAWVAERLNLPMAYVRSKPKAHGRGNQIEGRLIQGQRAVIIEDLISTGGSSLAVAEVVQGAGLSVLSVLAIFSYGLPIAQSRFANAQLPHQTLTDFTTLLQVALHTGTLVPAQVQTLKNWQQDPKGWLKR